MIYDNQLNLNFSKRLFTSKNENDDFKEEREGSKKSDENKKGPTKEESNRKHFRKFNKAYKKPEFLDDDYDHLKKKDGSTTIENTGYDIGDEEFLPDYFVINAQEKSYKRNTASINMPWLINGAPEIDIETRFIGE